MIDDENVVNCQSTKKTRETLKTAQAKFRTPRLIRLRSKIVFLAIMAKTNFLKTDIKFNPVLKEMPKVFENCSREYLDLINRKQRDEDNCINGNFTICNLHQVLTGLANLEE
jgi:hypothetical protein